MAINKTCVFNYSQLEALNADEDNWGSNGDEPYFVYVGFKSRTAAKNSTQTFLNTFDNDSWAGHIKQGQKKPIPAYMGRMAIPVSILEFVDILEANKNKTPLSTEIVGVIGIAIESDHTPFKAVKNLINQLRSQIHSTVANIVENLPADATQIKFDQVAPQFANALSKIKENLSPGFFQKVKLFLESFADPDDMVGISTQYSICVDKSTLALYNGLSGKKVQVPNIIDPAPYSLDYKASGVHYRVYGNLSLE